MCKVQYTAWCSEHFQVWSVQSAVFHVNVQLKVHCAVFRLPSVEDVYCGECGAVHCGECRAVYCGECGAVHCGECRAVHCAVPTDPISGTKTPSSKGQLLLNCLEKHYM